RRPGQHLQDLIQAAADGGIGRGTIARSRPSQRTRQCADADHDIGEGPRADRTAQSGGKGRGREEAGEEEIIILFADCETHHAFLSLGSPCPRPRRRARSAVPRPSEQLFVSPIPDQTAMLSMSPIISVANLSKTYGS